jgi:hypothetical protein
MEDRELDGEFSRDSFEGIYIVHEGGEEAEVRLFSKRGFRERERVSGSIWARWFYKLGRRRRARVKEGWWRFQWIREGDRRVEESGGAGVWRKREG